MSSKLPILLIMQQVNRTVCQFIVYSSGWLQFCMQIDALYVLYKHYKTRCLQILLDKCCKVNEDE